MICYIVFFLFKQKTAYEMRISDWSSDVCSSDLDVVADAFDQHGELVAAQARDQGLLAERGADATASLDQHLVAGCVAGAVVDQLETVQVEEQDRKSVV